MITTRIFWMSFFDFLLGPELVIAGLAVVAVLLGHELLIRWRRRRAHREDKVIEAAIAARLRKKAALGSGHSPSA